MTREVHRETDQMMEDSARQEATAEEQHAGVQPYRMPGERRALVENPGKRPSETFGRTR